MKYFLCLFAFGILCQNTLARGLDSPVLNDFERRFVRLETRQFSEGENLEHKLSTPKTENSDEKKFQKIGAKSYYIENNEKLDWFNAMDKCQELNAHLVSLQDEDEWNDLKEALQEGHSYWTDINDPADENDFRSQTSGLRPPFLKWDDNKSNLAPDAGDCVELSAGHDYKMNAVNCDYSKYFICESNTK